MTLKQGNNPFAGPGLVVKLATAAAIALALFHIYTAGFGQLEAMKQRSVHLAGIIFIGLLIFSGSKKDPANRVWRLIDPLLIVMGVGACAYIFLTYRDFAIGGSVLRAGDIGIGIALTLVVLEVGRRALGWALPGLAILFLLYAYFGPYAPDSISHRGYSIERIVQHLLLTQDGIFGFPIAVMASYVVLFILLGSFMVETGIVNFFNNLSLALAGRSAGGPAKVAVISSAFIGSVNGSAVANVATTGPFTIPLMKRSGYRPHYAAGVEAAASTSGQIMPPIMGSAAFIMSEVLNIPYTTIILAALIPAALFLLGILMMVHLRAKKDNLSALDGDQVPELRNILRSGLLLLPFVVLIGALFSGFTPTYSGFMAIVSSIVVGLLRRKDRLNFNGLLRALNNGIRTAVPLSIACAVVGIVMGMTNMTGLGPMLADVILTMANEKLFLSLVFTMLIAIILGAGLPTTAAYIVTSSIAAPALIVLNVPALAAHMFIFYFSIVSVLTPPLALAALVASGIAGADQMKTQWIGFRLALPAFLIPFVFVYTPELLGFQEGGSWFRLTVGLATSAIGVAALGQGFEGYSFRRLNLAERLLSFISAALLITPDSMVSAAGLAVFFVLTLYSYFTPAASALEVEAKVEQK